MFFLRQKKANHLNKKKKSDVVFVIFFIVLILACLNPFKPPIKSGISNILNFFQKINFQWQC